MTHRFDLSFITPKKSGPPRPPKGYVVLANDQVDEKGNHCITRTGNTESEFFAEIDERIRELEIIKNRAKRKYQTCKNGG